MLDSTTKHPQNRIHIFDPVSLMNNNSDRISSSDVTITPKSHGNTQGVLTTETNGHEILSYGHNNKNDKNDVLGIRLGVEKRNELDDDEHDISTPRLWDNSSGFRPTSPMSPGSRTRAIANGRRELMDMVKDLPESYYELSLKDIVEHKAEIIDITEEKTISQESSKVEEVKKTVNQNAKRVKKSESNKKMVRSGSVDNGKILLRTSFFPIFSGFKKDNKKNLGGSNSLKIVPMAKSRGPVTSESDASNGMSSKSGSSGSSSSSSRSSIDPGRHIQRFLPTWCFFNGKRITAKK